MGDSPLVLILTVLEMSLQPLAFSVDVAKFRQADRFAPAWNLHLAGYVGLDDKAVDRFSTFHKKRRSRLSQRNWRGGHREASINWGLQHREWHAFDVLLSILSKISTL